MIARRHPFAVSTQAAAETAMLEASQSLLKALVDVDQTWALARLDNAIACIRRAQDAIGRARQLDDQLDEQEAANETTQQEA